MQTPVTREYCANQVTLMTEKIDKLQEGVKNFEIKVIREIAEIPNALERKFDDRYADKHTEGEVDKIQANMNRLMWIVLSGVAVGVLNLIIK